MPGLGREIVKDWLPIKKWFKPFEQPAWRFEPDVVLKIKKKIKTS